MDRWGQVAPGPRQPPLGGLQNTPRWVIVDSVSVEDHPVQIAVVDDYDVVVAGVANMLEPYRDRVVVAELDTGRPVKDDVDIALYDSFAQPESDQQEIRVLVDNRVVLLASSAQGAEPSFLVILERLDITAAEFYAATGGN